MRIAQKYAFLKIGNHKIRNIAVFPDWNVCTSIIIVEMNDMEVNFEFDSSFFKIRKISSNQ